MSKYTYGVLKPIVESSLSMRRVLIQLGLRPTGGSHKHLSTAIRKLGISTEHFRGKGSNYGNRHLGGYKKLLWKKVLILDRRKGLKEQAHRLRRALLESGVPEICAVCGQPPVWNGKHLRLQIDHRNGNSLDNRPGNPRFLCPNCHSQTENFGSKNKPWGLKRV